MKLSLKKDLKFKIENKVNIYFLKHKNKTIVDKIFDRLRSQERLN